MADYGCYPLWESTESRLVNLSPEELNLSTELVDSLNQWASDFDATLNRENPLISNFTSKESGDKFENNGKQLYQILK